MKLASKFVKRVLGGAALTPLLMGGSAFAIPELQLYIEGATYDTSSETWVASGGSSLRLWAIGNVGGPGAKGIISDVKLAIAFNSSDSPSISLAPSTTGGYLGFTDPSTPSAPGGPTAYPDGAVPKLGDGSDLPTHGIYGTGTAFLEFALGDFDMTDSKGGDFINSVPSGADIKDGFQINVYEVTVTGTDSVHFDLYNSYFDKKNDAKYIFAPFSHDGEGGCCDTPGVPDAGTAVMLLGLALVGVEGMRRRLT